MTDAMTLELEQKQTGALNAVYEQGHKIVRYLVFLHFFLSIIFAAYYETWGLSISIGSLALLAFLLSAKLSPHTFLTRAVTGTVLQTYCALHIYQFHGLAEMHFFFFTAFAVMIVYSDRLCMWPGCFLIIAQHILFAYLHNQGVKVEFFEDDYVSVTKLSFHFGIALFHVGICSSWAHINRLRILENVKNLEAEKEKERATALREQLLTAIIDNSPSIIYAKDLEGRFVLVNSTFLRSFQLKRGSVIGRSNHDLFEKSIADQFRRNDLDVIEAKRALISQERAPLADGSERLYYSEKFPILDTKGEPLLTCGISSDVTDKIEAERLIQEQRAKLAHNAKLSSLGEMAGGISHEINNPLTIIEGKAYGLLRAIGADPVDHALLKKSLTTIIETSGRIAKIVKGLRSFARDGSRDPMKEGSIREVIDDALALCQEKIKSRGVNMKLVCGLDAVKLEMRSVEIAQILVNLLNNAYDAVLEANDPWIEVTCKDAHGGVEIKIRNSGATIDAALRDKIMEPFFTTKPVGKGTGLGLSISKGLAEAHGGTLTLDPNDECTAFVLWLPLRQAASAASTGSAAYA